MFVKTYPLLLLQRNQISKDRSWEIDLILLPFVCLEIQSMMGNVLRVQELQASYKRKNRNCITMETTSLSVTLEGKSADTCRLELLSSVIH